VELIDFTGNSDFGNYLEGLDKVVFTEKTGVNSVILDSAKNLDKVLANIAFSVSLYSGQMCTAPQNIFVPEGGVNTADGHVSFVLGAIQNKATQNRIEESRRIGSKIWLESKSVDNPMFKNARVASPTLLEVDGQNKEAYGQELFGPIALLIKTKDTSESISLASQLAKEKGAISCLAFTTDENVKQEIKQTMAAAATPVSFNLTGNIYVNQNASFSDFHVSGGNPAGNASFTNPEFLVKRFTWVGFREPVEA